MTETPTPGAVSASGAVPASQPVQVYVGMGANLGDRHGALRAAVAAMQRLPGTRVERVSALYASAPVDAGGPDYLNAVAELTTTVSPLPLLLALQALELEAGRERPYRNAPRTLDLDILWFGDESINLPELTVPHPRMMERAFVLRPLADLAPQRLGAAALEAVASQAIRMVEGSGWAALQSGLNAPEK